ncbi:hypothetical protein F5883DRAFT_435103, partial [Diaporthe sp. PMI_573]
RAWTKVFRRFEWLDAAVSLGGHPVLIGEGAKRLYDGLYKDEPIYLVFLSLCCGGELQYKKPNILDSLQEYQYDQNRHEAYILGTNITVNVCDGIGGSCAANQGIRNFAAIHYRSWSDFDTGDPAVLYYGDCAVPKVSHMQRSKSILVSLTQLYKRAEARTGDSEQRCESSWLYLDGEMETCFGTILRKGSQ